MGASAKACTLAGRTISCAGADCLGRTTETVGTARSAVSLRSVARAWMRGKIPEITTPITVTNANRIIHQWGRLGLEKEGFSLRDTVLPGSTFLHLPKLRHVTRCRG